MDQSMTRPVKQDSNEKIIIHIDLDCFYAQVESVRLNIPLNEPLAVQQWGSLLAVNYPARLFDIKRGDNIHIALKKCPTIHLPHVKTIGDNHDPLKSFDRKYQKADLSRYRNASQLIFKIFEKYVDPLKIEKAGVDEAYFDVTDLVSNLNNKNTPKYSNYQWFYGMTKEKEDEKEKEKEKEIVLTNEEQRLLMGANIAAKIRKEIKEKLHYTCSAGIAKNKLLAKMIISSRFIQNLMENFKIKKVPGLGGKLGNEISTFLYSKMKESNNISNEYQKISNEMNNNMDPSKFIKELKVGQLLHFVSLNDLIKRFNPETALFIHNLCNGIENKNNENTINSDKKYLNGMNSTKNFMPNHYPNDTATIIYWINILSEEIYLRLKQEKENHNRIGKTLLVTLTNIIKLDDIENEKPKTKTIVKRYNNLPFNITKDKIISIITNLLFPEQRTRTKIKTSTNSVPPCQSICLSVRDFEKLEKIKEIKCFFSEEVKNSEKKIHSDEIDILDQEYSNHIRDKWNNIAMDRKIPTNKTNIAQDQKDNIFMIKDQKLDKSCFQCERCKEFISNDKYQEHSDYHFAEDLNQDWIRRKADDSLKTNTFPKKSKLSNNKHGPMDMFLVKEKSPI